MRVYSFSQWQYEGDVFACQLCDEEKGVMYVLADKLEDVEGLIDTPLGQRCGECLAQTLAELMPYVRLDATRLNAYKGE